MHHKTWIPLCGAFVTILGWFAAWNPFLSSIYAPNPGLNVKAGFISHFGKNPTWWLVHIVIVSVLIVLDLAINAIQTWWWPSRVDIWKELEQDPSVRRKLEEVNGEEGDGVGTVGLGSDEVEGLEGRDLKDVGG